MRTILKLSAILPLFSALAACGTTGSSGETTHHFRDVLVRDRDVSMPALRASWQLRESVGIDAQIVTMTADSEQQIAADEQVPTDGDPIQGPANLKHDVRLTSAMVLARFDIVRRERLDIDFLVGLGVNRFGIDISGGEGDSELENTTSFFPLSLAINTRLTEGLSGHLHYTRDPWSDYPVGEFEYEHVELLLSYPLTESARIYGGWREMQYVTQVEEAGGFLSGTNAEFVLSGPTLGLHLTY